jgi:site-specific recombinase XerD
MTESASQMLESAIGDYLKWMISKGYSHDTWQCYGQVLKDFLTFIGQRELAWNDMFTWETLQAFQKHDRRTYTSSAVRGLSRYLSRQGKLRAPIPRSHQREDLPEIYEDYLLYRQRNHQSAPGHLSNIKRVLCAFDDYLKREKIKLATLSIDQVDAFLADFTSRFAPATRRVYRCFLRSFLRYLHHERRIIKSDLASLLVSPRVYAKDKPPRFLRPHEVQRLFANLKLSTASELRTCAMIHLAYSLGLRPIEISTITLDDISFTEARLELRARKGKNPITLPLPEDAIKAIAAYLIGGRPKSQHRRVFLTVNAPPEPISPNVVSHHVRTWMRRLNLSASAYWLRHTYAQNLLEAGASIYEIKEMLGHDTIEATQRYLHIHIELMRTVLFDEEL